MTHVKIKTLHSWLKVIIMCSTCITSIWASGFYFHEKLTKNSALSERLDHMEYRFDKRFDKIEMELGIISKNRISKKDRKYPESQPTPASTLVSNYGLNHP